MTDPFTILAAQYRPMVLAYLRAMVRDAQLAEDPVDLDYEKDDVARNLEAVRIRIDTSKLRVANPIWGEQTFPFNEDWKATVTGSYGLCGYLVRSGMQSTGSRQQSRSDRATTTHK